MLSGHKADVLKQDGLGERCSERTSRADHERGPRNALLVVGKPSRSATARVWTPEVGTESMGTMQTSTCCPEPNAAAALRAAF
eukprot:3252867-Pyramimonas_sp.AAC.1